MIFLYVGSYPSARIQLQEHFGKTLLKDGRV